MTSVCIRRLPRLNSVRVSTEGAFHNVPSGVFVSLALHGLSFSAENQLFLSPETARHSKSCRGNAPFARSPVTGNRSAFHAKGRASDRRAGPRFRHRSILRSRNGRRAPAFGTIAGPDSR